MIEGTTVIKPLRDLILIQIDEPIKQSKTGIFLAKAWEDAVNTATVQEIGPEVTVCEKGQRILINPYAYIDITGTTLKLIKEVDVLGHV